MLFNKAVKSIGLAILALLPGLLRVLVYHVVAKTEAVEHMDDIFTVYHGT